MTSPDRHIQVVEVGPRDGLQNEPTALPVAVRVRLIEALLAAGVTTVEVGSFVSPALIPQMANSGEVLAALPRARHLSYPMLVPNLQGLEAARAANAETVAIFAAATDGFSMRNLNRSRDEAIRRFEGVAKGARAAGMRVRGYVSCAVHCPYEGWVSPEATASVAERLMQMGCYEVSLCDTTGMGTPAQARAMLRAAATRVPVDRLAVHFHDTYGQALANTLACIDLGVVTVDSSVSGLGGCPFAPGAAGNLATEDLVYMLHGMGFRTGIDLDRLIAAAGLINEALGRTLSSRVDAARAKACREPATSLLSSVSGRLS